VASVTLVLVTTPTAMPRLRASSSSVTAASPFSQRLTRLLPLASLAGAIERVPADIEITPLFCFTPVM
jgi:hypothetical protein